MGSTFQLSYHFIGVGGIGMSGLAELLVRQGHRVSGSDLAANAITHRLETLGVTFSEGHRPEHLGDAEIVVHSTAVKEDNPELAAARTQGRTILRRGEMLARLMAGSYQIAVTGAHGKTSTTAMVASILRAAELDPTVLVGAVWDSLGSNAVLGHSNYFVAEADFGATQVKVQGLGCRYRLWHRGKELGEVSLPLAGAHYVLNSLAACAVAHSLGLPFAAWQRGLEHLGQIHRRCQIKGEVRGILVVDDYGHHPTEIDTTLAALAQAFPERRLVVIFQPHRYSRTRALLPEFFPVFNPADVVWVTEIYSAGEPALPGLSGCQIHEGILKQGHPEAYFVADTEALLHSLIQQVAPGDIVLTLGAGDIWRLGEQLLARLTGRSAAPISTYLGDPPWPGARL